MYGALLSYSAVHVVYWLCRSYNDIIGLFDVILFVYYMKNEALQTSKELEVYWGDDK